MRHNRIPLVLAVALGSALGSVARYLISVALFLTWGSAFPWGTLIANTLGSFLIGLYARTSGPEGRLRHSPATRHFVLTGFCGGFTTLSLFSFETVELIGQGAAAAATVNVLASVALWLLGVVAGSRFGNRLNRSANTHASTE